MTIEYKVYFATSADVADDLHGTFDTLGAAIQHCVERDKDIYPKYAIVKVIEELIVEGVS